MSRTKGALNKPKRPSTTFHSINLEKQIEGAPITRANRAYKIVNWGIKNDYPFQLLNLYQNSPTHHSCIDYGVRNIIGEGVDYEAMQIDGSQVVPNYSTTWDELIESLALDYMLYGTYCIEIIKNRSGKDYSFYHIPAEKVRCGEYDEDGVITKYYISADWSAVGVNQPVEIDAIEMRDDMKIAMGKPYLYVYKKYSPTVRYYTMPHYAAGIQAIQSEIEYCNFDFKHISNGFCTAGILSLPPVETESEKEAIIDNIQRMFQGSNNANNLMMMFSNGIDDAEQVKFTPFSSDNTADDYDGANERAISRILAAHQIPSRTLIGMPDVGGTGFNSEAAMLESAHKLYCKLVGNANRNAIIKVLNQMFKMQGIDQEIIIKPLTFVDEDDVEEPRIDKDVEPAENNIDISDKNIEEKVE